jgi:hypothetical protein
MVRRTFAEWFSLAVIVLSCALLAGCATAGGSSENAERGRTSSGGSSKEVGGTTVGGAIAEADLQPIGDSGTSGTAVFKEVGNLGVQVELEVSGLPTKEPNATYYAQVHEGSCSEEQTGEEHEEEHSVSSFGPALALVRLDRLVAKVPGLQAHGGHEHGIPEEPPGSIEQPISFSASADGSASVTSLLEGVDAKRLRSRAPAYIHLHAVNLEGAPEELSCGDLVGASRRGSG